MERKYRAELNTDQDSWAWKADAHDLGWEYYDKHKGDPGELSGKDRTLLARALFTADAATGELKLKLLQDVFLKQVRLPPFTQTEMDSINDTVDLLLGRPDPENKKTVSHAQAVMLWHVLIDQADLLLLKPNAVPNTMGW